MTSTSPAWYPDPTQRNESRYFDGTQWTDHVSNRGVSAVDPMGARNSGTPEAALDSLDAGVTIGSERDPALIQKQLYGSGYSGVGLNGPQGGGGGTIFTEPILVVNQKAKIFELNSEYSVFDENGAQIAAVSQVGQTGLKKAMRLVSNLDNYMTHHFNITDARGAVMLKITRPRKIIKSTVVVSDGAGNELGRIVQQNAIGKIRFGLEVGGQMFGMIKAQNWRAWNFTIEDAAGVEIAKITKTWEGFAKAMFTTADNYVLQIHARQAEPLNSLIVASALSIDTALKQDGG